MAILSSLFSKPLCSLNPLPCYSNQRSWDLVLVKSYNNHILSLEALVGLSFICRTGVVYFTLVCFLSLPLLPQFLSCALSKFYFRICTLYSSWVRQYFLVHTSFTSMPSEFKLNSFVLDLSFILLLNQSTIDVTLCASDFSFLFFCFLEVDMCSCCAA